MNSGNRLFLALGLLVAVWIIVYWAWDPRDREPPVTRGDAPPVAVEVDGGTDGGSAGGALRSPAPDSADLVLPEPSGRTSRPPDQQPSGQGGEGGTAARPDLLPLPPVAAAEDESPEPPVEPTLPPQGVIPPEFDEYTIRAGDTFERIAARELGDRAFGAAIARANPLKDPRRLKIGDVIRIPRDPANIQGAPVGGGTPGAATPPTQAQAEYVVQPGDTLTGISQSFYGTTQHWEVIYAANRGELSSPEALRVGQALIIPPPPAR